MFAATALLLSCGGSSDTTETAETSSTPTLGVLKIDCRVFTVEAECRRSTPCGWCGATSSCVAGNAIGPLEACSGGYVR
jgi:hypothetical protein